MRTASRPILHLVAAARRAAAHTWVGSVVRFVRARLTPGEYLGLSLTLGVLAISVGAWAFIEVADAVHENDDIAALDEAIANWLHVHGTPLLTRIVRQLTHLGGPVLVVLAALIAATVLWQRRLRHDAVATALTVLGGLAMNTTLKAMFDRARPVFDEPIATAFGQSFPSGHVAGATLLYCSLAAILSRHTRSWHHRLAYTLAAVMLIQLVAFTRLYLGVHYFTDVLAAQAVAFAWFAVCFTAAHTHQRRQAHRSSRHAL